MEPSHDTDILHLPGPEQCIKASCCLCLQQLAPAVFLAQPDLLTGRPTISDFEAESIARRLAILAAQDRQHIRNRLSLYGDALRSKWKKLTRSKREATILSAQPDLYYHKFPEQRLRALLEQPDNVTGIDDLAERFASLSMKNDPAWFSTRQRNALLLPYLNVQTLSEDPSRLLSLLHHRSQSSPKDWLSFDGEQMRMGFHHGCLADEFTQKCVVMYGKDMGKIVEWEKEACHDWKIIIYPLAKLILEAQSVLLGFLRKMVDILVTPGVTHEGHTQWDLLTSTGFKASGEMEFWSVYSNQPFSAAPSFDPSKWLQQALSRLAAAQDHLTFLQTDPAYFQSFVDLGHAKTHKDESTHSILMEKVFFLTQALHDVRVLRQIVEQCQHLSRIKEERQSSMTPYSPLPYQYEMGMLMLGQLVGREMYLCLRKLKHMIPRGAFKHCYILSDAGKGTIGHTLNVSHEGKKGLHAVFLKKPVLWALKMLCEDPNDILGTNKCLLMRFLDDCMADPKQRRQIDEPVFAILSQLALLDSISSDINHNIPRVRSELMNWEKIPDSLSKAHLTARYLGCQPREPNNMECVRLCPLIQKVCDLPWPKGNKDEKWLNEATIVRERMSELWANARDVVRDMCATPEASRPMLPEDIETELSFISADLTPEYEAEKEAERTEVRKYIAAREEAKESAKQTVWGEHVTPTIEPPPVRIKDKTRPNDEAIPNQEEVPVDETEQKLQGMRIEVKSKSMHILRRLFPLSREEDPKGGKVEWKDFVTAMTDAGFAATHCGGSAVSFAPGENAPMVGSIVFHKPHPETTLQSMMLRVMGKRLRKWFGWERETFVERQ